VDAYRDELTAAQQRIESLEGKIQRQGDEIEQLRDAARARDEHLKRLQEKFDGAARGRGRFGNVWAVATVGTIVLVAVAVVVGFRRGGAPAPLAPPAAAAPSQVADAGVAAPTATQTAADPLDPPAHHLGAGGRAEAPSGTYDEAAQRRALEAVVWSGRATASEIKMLRAICSTQGDRACRDRCTAMLRALGNAPTPAPSTGATLPAAQ
jgi:hypothetical protein